MNEPALLQNYLVIGGLLFAIGMVGFVVRRNVIVAFLCVEIMLQGVSLSLVAWNRYHSDGNFGGQMMVLFIIAVAAAEAGIGLALILMLFQRSGTLDLAFWQDLREDDQPAFVDRQLLDEPEDRAWPSLTPAGVEPEEEEELYRSRV